jgi:hypothetical protein
MPKRVARQTWSAQKARYYAKHRRHKLNAGQPWSEAEDKAVLAREVTDVSLSTQIGRGVAAIQQRRCKLKSICR